MLASNSVLVEIDGSIRRITLEDFMEAIQTGGLSLRQYAWGVPILQDQQSSSEWGVVGNTDLWEEYKSMIGRYLVTNEGKAAKLSKTDSTVYADGTTLDETAGHVMVYAPRLYYLVQTDETSGITYLWGSMQPISGHYIEAQCVGAYMGYMDGTALTSRSGVVPTGSKNINALWTAAQVNGSQFGVIGNDFRRWVNMINLFEFGDTNVQTNVGYGICGSSGQSKLHLAANYLSTGATTSLGDSCGAISIDISYEDTDASVTYTGVNSSRVNFFGIEDLWGWFLHSIQGIYFGSANNDDQDGTEVFIYEGNRMPSTDELATHPSGDYRQLTRLTSTTGSYIKTQYLGEYFDLIPTATGGSSSSYWCDQWTGSTTGQLCYCFGNSNNGANAGLAYANSNNAWSNTNSNRGSRLAYYGDLTFVNGSEI